MVVAERDGRDGGWEDRSRGRVVGRCRCGSGDGWGRVERGVEDICVMGGGGGEGGGWWGRGVGRGAPGRGRVGVTPAEGGGEWKAKGEEIGRESCRGRG